MYSTLKSLRALSDPTRLRIVALLEKDELSVNELQEVTRLGQSRISTHLGLLADCGLVQARRDGKRTFYKLNPQAGNAAGEFIRLAILGAGELPERAGDGINLKRILARRHEQAQATKDGVSAAVIPAGEPDAEAKPRQVLIISADIGEGHDLPARAVAREFRDEDPDANISIVNGLPAMGPVLTKVLRENSAFMFTFMPWLFDLQYRLFMNFGPTRWLSRKLLTFFGCRGLMRLIRAHNPDVIVSTYPGVTAVLVGEALMREADIAAKMRELLGR